MSGVIKSIGVIIMGAFFAFKSWGLVTQSKQTDSWLSAPATVISSKVQEYRSQGKKEYRPIINYSYEVEGKLYRGNRLTMMHVQPTENSAKEVIKEYPNGKKIEVFYNPENANKSIIQGGFDKNTYLLPGMGGLISLIGIICLVVSLIKKRTTRSTQT